MHVALIVETLNPNRGGAEAYAGILVKWLRSRGHEVSVVCDRASEAPVSSITKLELRKHPRWYRVLRFSTLALETARDLSPDVIWSMARVPGAQVCQPHGGVHLRSRAGSVSTSRNAALRMFRRVLQTLSWKQIAIRVVERRVFNDGSGVHIALSGMTAGHMRDCYGVPGDRIRIVPNGVDTDRFRPGGGGNARRIALGLAGAPVVGFLAHMYDLKGFGSLLRAMAAGGRWHVLAAGRCKQRRWEAMARRLDVADRLHLLGPLERPEELYGSVDVFAHPTFYDPCSLVVLEALASGVPVVTTSANGAAELITDGREGRVIENAGDVPALSQAIDHCLEPARLSTMGISARSLAETCNWEEHFLKMEAIIREVRDTR